HYPLIRIHLKAMTFNSPSICLFLDFLTGVHDFTNGILRHGETGTILMPIPLTNAMLIPQKTTFEVLNKKYVFVIDKNSKIEQREVVVGQALENLFVVTKGLKVGDKILLDGLRLVKVNEKIKYNLKDSKKVLTSLDVYAE
ncbi:MAG: hypothetical protein KKH44_10190, partial [Bacteroidetes bacterium]|nr:hypothetical protein [Bacteroidota bacterium]